MESDEVWKKCEGFKNSYEVSTLGKVRSLNYNKTKQIQELSQNLCGDYLRVSMDNQSANVHRLVAKAFLPNPENLPEVDHINRDKFDNRLENLRWVSKSVNSINREPRATLTGKNCIFLTDENKYRLRIRRKGIYITQTFETLDEAVDARNKYIPLV